MDEPGTQGHSPELRFGGRRTTELMDTPNPSDIGDLVDQEPLTHHAAEGAVFRGEAAGCGESASVDEQFVDPRRGRHVAFDLVRAGSAPFALCCLAEVTTRDRAPPGAPKPWHSPVVPQQLPGSYRTRPRRTMSLP